MFVACDVRVGPFLEEVERLAGQIIARCSSWKRKPMSSMKTQVRARTAPSLPFDDVKSKKAGTTNGRFAVPRGHTRPRRSGTGAASAAVPVRLEL